MTGNLSRERKSLAARARERREAGQTAFLTAFAEVGTVTAACLTSGVGATDVLEAEYAAAPSRVSPSPSTTTARLWATGNATQTSACSRS